MAQYKFKVGDEVVITEKVHSLAQGSMNLCPDHKVGTKFTIVQRKYSAATKKPIYLSVTDKNGEEKSWWYYEGALKLALTKQPTLFDNLEGWK